MEERYMQRGVSASKEDVHNAIKNIDKGVYPNAFCKIVPDLLGGDEKYCNIASDMNKLMPNNDLQIVENSGHNVHLEKQKEFIKLVNNFIAKLV